MSSSIGEIVVFLLSIWYYFMDESVAATVENSNVIIGLEGVRCDYHDSSVEVVQVVG